MWCVNMNGDRECHVLGCIIIHCSNRNQLLLCWKLPPQSTIAELYISLTHTQASYVVCVAHALCGRDLVLGHRLHLK